MAQDLALSVVADLPLPKEAEESSLWISKANR
jgi:hypothetical protein